LPFYDKPKVKQFFAKVFDGMILYISGLMASGRVIAKSMGLKRFTQLEKEL